MSKIYSGNQWAILKNMSVDYTGFKPMIDFNGLAPATPEILRAVKRWMDRPPQFPFWAEEWQCLYCGSPVPLPETHCVNCGAPRNWLIG